jgi:hypothetical protein
MLSCAGVAGCFDAEGLIESRRQQVMQKQLAEVDLGTFRVVLPRLPGENRGGVISFHAFGKVANADRSTVDHNMEIQGPELKHNMLMTVRETTAEELREPQLEILRQRVASVINNTLHGDLVQAVGFHSFSYSAL